MKKMTKIFAAFTAATILTLAACSPVTGPEIPSPPAGKGVVNIMLGVDETVPDLPQGRTLLPTNLSFDSYDVKFTKAGESTPAVDREGVSAASLTGIELNAGTYTLELKAYSGTEGSKLLTAQGTESGIVVTEGQTANVTVHLTLNAAAGGTGTLDVTITNSSGLTLIQADLVWTPLSGGTAEGTQNILTGLSGTKDLNAGYYLVTVILSNDEVMAKRNDIAHIGAGQTTPVAWEFTANNFSTIVEDIWLLGVNNQWDVYGSTNKLTQETNGTFVWEGDMSQGYFRFSLQDTTGWGTDKDRPKRFQPESNGASITFGPAAVMTYVANNAGSATAWNLGGAGYYRFVVDPYEKTVTVTKPVAVTSVTIKDEDGNATTTISLPQGATNYPFTAEVQGTNAADTGVTWAISSGTVASGTSIDQTTGQLTIDNAETVSNTFTITATSTADTTKSGSVTVTVTSKSAQALPAPQSVTLSGQGEATWTAPSVETNVVKYSVRLYKGSAAEGSAREVIKGQTYSEDFLSAMRGAGVGSYTVKVKAVGDGTNYGVSPEVESAAQTVSQGTAVQHTWWYDTSKARWVNVDGSSNYAVQLYKGGTVLGTPVPVNRESTQNPGNPAETVTTHDFTSAITTEGPGSYTFGVVTKGDAYLILDAAETKLANTDAYKYDVTLSAPSSLIWSGTTAQWDAVTNAAGYEVQLYNGGSPPGSPVSVTSGTSYAGFSVSAAGLYTFTVKAIGTGTAGTGAYLDSSAADSAATASDAGKLLVGGAASITLEPLEGWTGTLGISGGGSASIPKSNGSLTISVTGSSFTSFVWIVDGAVVSETGSSITLTGSAYALGGHSVTVYALDTNGVPWSPESPISFTVTAQ